jgi:hypothetical protein
MVILPWHDKIILHQVKMNHLKRQETVPSLDATDKLDSVIHLFIREGLFYVALPDQYKNWFGQYNINTCHLIIHC